HRDLVRVYVEYMDSQTGWEDLSAQVIDKDHSDLLNAFVDIHTLDICDSPVWFRYGRQELLYGSQRLVSPLDWANTRRTFQGAKALYTGEKFDFDLFWLQPVVPATGTLSSVDNNQNFAGIWTTYRPRKGQYLDLYYLMLDN